MKVVIDTNVLVSALLFGGQTERVRELWKSGVIAPLVSEAIMTEYLRVLAYPKFRLTQAETASPGPRNPSLVRVADRSPRGTLHPC